MNTTVTADPPAPSQPDLSHSLMECSPVPMAELAGAGHIMCYVNSALCRLVGASRVALLGQPFAATVPAGDDCLALLARVYRTGDAETHTEAAHPGPHPAYWSYAMWPVLDAEHHPVGTMVQVTETTEFHHQMVAMNEALMRSSVQQHELTEVETKFNAQLQAEITERTQAEAALRTSEAKYRTLFESMDEGFCLIEQVDGVAGEPVEFRYVEANPAFTTHSGVNAVVGKTIGQAFPDEAEDWRTVYEAVLRTGEPRRFEHGLLTQGRVLDLYAFRVEDATQRRVAVLFQDITARRKAEEARLRLAAIVACSDDAIISKSLDGIITSWNAGAERIFGYRAAEMIGQSIRRLIANDLQAEEDDILARLRRGERVEHFETVRRAKDGRLLDVSVAISPLRDAHGTIIGASKIARDITAQKQLERELAQRATKLERLNAELQQFGYIVSHDLQEPLRTITNFVQLLAQRAHGKLDAEADTYMTFAVEGAQRMQALITDLMAYTRMGEKKQGDTAVDCEAVLAHVLDDLQLAITDSAAAVTYDALPTVHGDASQLRLVFQNLIGNALKFRSTAPPRIHVSARGAGSQWAFSVRDNGIGLDLRQAERIFQVFQRLHTHREYTGTGIGLAICKKIVEQHGGRIWVESEPGTGATFFFTLPAQKDFLYP